MQFNLDKQVRLVYFLGNNSQGIPFDGRKR